MGPRAILIQHSNSHPFEDRTIDLGDQVKVGRAVAKCKPQNDNAIFDCKVLSRNHAVIWFDNGKFYIKDTSSSNGTFINSNRLGPANQVSPNKEIHSDDIIQFGVEVVDSSSKITHGCIILRIKLYYPDGSEASQSTPMFNIPTRNMLPPYYSYTQMLEREQQVYEKLSTIEKVLEEAHLLADMTINAKKENENLVKQIADLQKLCDEKTGYAKRLELDLEKLDDKIEKLESLNEDNLKLIRSQEARYKEKEVEIECLRKQLNRVIKQDHRLTTTLFLLLMIALVVGGFDMIAMFARLM